MIQIKRQINVKGCVDIKTLDLYLLGQQSEANINIELTYRCPLQCKQCFRHYFTLPNDNIKKINMKRKMAESYDMPLDNLKKIIEFTNGRISFCGQFSDPAYHPNFLNILDLCSEYPDKNFMIHTSAHQKNIEWYIEAYKRTSNNVIWKFGLDGLVDTSFIYRTGQKSQLIWDAMILGTKMGINIHWQYIVFKYNEHQIEEASQLAKKYEIPFQLIYTDRDTDNIERASEQHRPTGTEKQGTYI